MLWLQNMVDMLQQQYPAQLMPDLAQQTQGCLQVPPPPLWWPYNISNSVCMISPPKKQSGAYEMLSASFLKFFPLLRKTEKDSE